MFQTLKARRNNAGESAYVVQSSGIPFEKNKGKQRACTFCKLKKLKCVAEGDSCMKCLKQGLECSYRTAAKPDGASDSKSSKGASKPEGKAQPPTDKEAEIPEQSADSDLSITVSSTVASTSDSTPSTSDQSDPSFPEDLSFADLLGNELAFDFWSISNDSGMDLGDTSMCLTSNDGGENSCEAIAFPRINLSKSNHDLPLRYSRGDDNGDGEVPEGSSQITSTPLPEPLSWEPIMIPEMQMLPLDDEPSGSGVAFSAMPGIELQETETASPQPSSTGCPCLEKLMGANEDMQVKLVWGAYPLNGVTVSVDDMLQCQKDILVSCETLLECKKCSLRSDYVMLIVSMCHEMMNGIGDLSAMLLPGSERASSKRSRSESDGGRKRGLKAGGWRLDDEDEIQVIKSLIGIRITRLGSLISLLEKAVKANHPAYEWVIRALRQSITERIATIGSEREGVGFTLNS
ncbi:hypothetical protein O1611_g3486 [Lasiodiplodia mahajangana]|uniref:Uncharacterized protein n=1 Tax=Lasiodiplodia mahajangana TaxID=1108764 RepID=A0ACC2JRN7_9PEZI|nr:hypothetical protein O1611_g3486 [Lasiodiplodia mahajangana]